MAMKLTTTKRDTASEEALIKVMVYGPAGAGKTRLAATLPDVVIISAESGLLSLRNENIPVIEVQTIEDVREAYRFLMGSEEAKHFRWIALDSITEIAEVVLTEAKKGSKDPRAAYGVLIDEMTSLCRGFRDMPRNIYFSAKMEKTRDEITGAVTFGVGMPGAKLANNIPYLFDELFALRTFQPNLDSPVERALQTMSDTQYLAKDRSGSLKPFEPADLGAIARKIHSALDVPSAATLAREAVDAAMAKLPPNEAEEMPVRTEPSPAKTSKPRAPRAPKVAETVEMPPVESMPPAAAPDNAAPGGGFIDDDLPF